MIQVGTTQFFDRSASLLTSLSAQANTLQTQISTGKRLASAADDVVAYQRLAGLKQGTADDHAYSSNIGLAQSILQQSDTTLDAVQTQLQNAAELTVQANSGVLTDANRKSIGDQIQSIADDLAGLANSRDLRGQPLFGGATGTTAVITNPDGSIGFAGTGEAPPIPVGDGETVQVNDSARRVFGGIPGAGGSTTDIFALLSGFATALKAGGAATTAAATTGDALKMAMTQVANVQGAAGARAARLDLTAARLKDVATNREVTRSALEDTDLTTAITDLQKTMTILTATQSSFSKLSQLSLFNYLK